MASRDDQAYVEFVEASQLRLRRTAFLMTGDWALAADLTQEALIKVYSAWPRLDKGGGLATYARRSIVSTVIDHRRKLSRRPLESAEELDRETVDDGADARADRQLVVRALAQVPPRQRACLVLRYFEDLSVAETAATMKSSPGTVKSQTAHGLVALRRELERLGMSATDAALEGV